MVPVIHATSGLDAWGNTVLAFDAGTAAPPPPPASGRTQSIAALPAAGSPRHKAWRAAAKGALSRRTGFHDSLSAKASAAAAALPAGSPAALADAGVTDSQIARIIAGQLKSGARFEGRVSAGGARAGRPGSLKAVARAAAGAAAARMGLKGVDGGTTDGARYGTAVSTPPQPQRHARASTGAVVAPAWAVAAARRESGGD